MIEALKIGDRLLAVIVSRNFDQPGIHSFTLGLRVVLNDDVPTDAPGAIKRLADLGVGTRPFFLADARQPVFRRSDFSPVSEILRRKGLRAAGFPSQRARANR